MWCTFNITHAGWSQNPIWHILDTYYILSYVPINPAALCSQYSLSSSSVFVISKMCMTSHSKHGKCLQQEIKWDSPKNKVSLSVQQHSQIRTWLLVHICFFLVRCICVPNTLDNSCTCMYGAFCQYEPCYSSAENWLKVFFFVCKTLRKKMRSYK